MPDLFSYVLFIPVILGVMAAKRILDKADKYDRLQVILGREKTEWLLNSAEESNVSDI